MQLCLRKFPLWSFQTLYNKRMLTIAYSFSLKIKMCKKESLRSNKHSGDFCLTELMNRNPIKGLLSLTWYKKTHAYRVDKPLFPKTVSLLAVSDVIDDIWWRLAHKDSRKSNITEKSSTDDYEKTNRNKLCVKGKPNITNNWHQADSCGCMCTYLLVFQSVKVC